MIEFLESQDKLTLLDLIKHPIWRETDNPKNEREICPSDNDIGINEDVAYVATTFIFNNSCIWGGYTRISEGEITLLKIFVPDGGRVKYILSNAIRQMRGQTCESFAKEFNLTIESVFPIKCQLICQEKIEHLINCDEL